MARTQTANIFTSRRKSPQLAEEANAGAAVAFIGERLTVDGQENSLLARVSIALAAFALLVGSGGYLLL